MYFKYLVTVHQPEKSTNIETPRSSSPHAAGKEKHKAPVLGTRGETQMEAPVKTAAVLKSTAFHLCDAARQPLLN